MDDPKVRILLRIFESSKLVFGSNKERTSLAGRLENPDIGSSPIAYVLGHLITTQIICGSRRINFQISDKSENIGCDISADSCEFTKFVSPGKI